MRVNSVAMFAVAFVCAALAALLVRGMISSQPKSQTSAVQTEAGGKTIIVAARDLKPGDLLTRENIREMRWAAETPPNGAFSAKDALLKASDGRAVTSFIAENEPIMPAKFAAPPESPITLRLSAGMTGVTIRVNDASGVGGNVLPDDRVDVVMTQQEREGLSSTKAYAVTLLRNMRVLAIDQQTQRKPQAQPPKTVTLEANPEDAKKLALAQTVGQLSLVLTKGASSTDPGGVIGVDDLLAKPAPPPKQEVITIEPVVTITRQTERKEYRVPEGK
jgi:pilus assembly protein CpaB